MVVPWFSDREPPYIGWTGLVLAAIGVIACWRNREVKLFFAVGLGSVLFSLGKSDTFHGLLYALIPEVEKVRTPSFGILLFGFAASALLAFGIDTLASLYDTHIAWARRILVLLAGAGTILTVTTLMAVTFDAKGFDPAYLMLSAFAAIALAALLYACWQRVIQIRTAQILAAGLLVIELGNVATAGYRHIEQGWPLLDPLWKFQDIAQFMRNQNDGSRIDVDSDAIPFNFGDWYDVDTFAAYLASVSKDVFWVYSQNDYWCRMLFATKYYAGKKPIRPNQVPLFTSSDGVQVYQNPDALPRAWITHRISTVPQAEAVRRLQAAERLREEPFMLQPSPLLDNCSSGDQVRIVNLGPTKQKVVVNTGCRGLLIDADAFYPGWSVRVDGKSQPILEIYGALRGVVVPAGEHTIEFRYVPLSVILGALLTLSGFAGLVWLTVILPRRRREALV